MSILALLLALPCGLPPAPHLTTLASRASQEGEGEDRVAATVEALKEAFAKGDSTARIAAIEAGVEVVDPKVIAAIGKGLADDDPAVALAACDALGRMPHEDSLDQLERHYRKLKKQADDEEGLVAVLKAVGRLADPDGIDLLSDDPFKAKGYPVVQARILGLGNIRSKDSVEAVFDLMNKVGKRDLDSYMGELRLALVQLTGEDRGDDPRQWQAWWQEHHKDFEVAARPAPLPPEMALRWNAFWGLEQPRGSDEE